MRKEVKLRIVSYQLEIFPCNRNSDTKSLILLTSVVFEGSVVRLHNMYASFLPDR